MEIKNGSYGNPTNLLLFLTQSWKWKMGPSKISFLEIMVIFHFMIMGRRVRALFYFQDCYVVLHTSHECVKGGYWQQCHQRLRRFHAPLPCRDRGAASHDRAQGRFNQAPFMCLTIINVEAPCALSTIMGVGVNSCFLDCLKLQV